MPAKTHCMQRLLVLFAALLLFLFLCSALAYAETIVTVTGSTVNIRSGPATTYDKIGSATQGETYRLLREENGWYNIELADGSDGWIISTYGQKTTNDTLPAYVKAASGTVNIRSGAGTSYDRLGQLSGDITVKVNGEEGDWYKITTGAGQTGYVAKWLVVSATAAKPGDTGDTPSGTDNTGSTTTLPAGYKQGTVNEDTLNIRSGPSTSYDILGELSKGTKVAIYESSGNWFRVLSETNLSGWVSSSYITLSNVQVSGSLPNVSELPAWSGSELNGEADFDSSATESGGAEITISSDSRLMYSISHDGDDLVLRFDMHLFGDSGGCGDLEIEQVNENELVVSGAEYLYYKESLSNDGRTLTVVIGENPVAGKIIYIDPGHGSYNESGSFDPGAIGQSGLEEHTVTYDVAQRVEEILLSWGADVRLTRGATSYADLYERAWMANAAGADIFVSIHTNSATNTNAHGTSTWFYAPANTYYDRAERLAFAQTMQAAMVAATGLSSYGVHEERFVVVRETVMPSVLVETAFISNLEEEALLASDEFRDRLAEGITNGIRNYLEGKAN